MRGLDAEYEGDRIHTKKESVRVRTRDLQVTHELDFPEPLGPIMDVK